jgi:hypothetical protein
MGDIGSNTPSSWQGTHPDHPIYQSAREEEPSSSITSSSSASFAPAVYRGQSVFQNSSRYVSDSYDVQVSCFITLPDFFLLFDWILVTRKKLILPSQTGNIHTKFPRWVPHGVNNMGCGDARTV